jgi:hypothetical protein
MAGLWDDSFEVRTRTGITCGWCGLDETAWPAEPKAAAWLALGYIELTGVLAVGVGPAGELVVLAEVVSVLLSGKPAGYLPHLCADVPAAVREQYADEIAAVVSGS